MAIRKATENDFGVILSMSELFWESTVYDEPFCPNQTIISIQAAYDCGLLAVVEKEGDVIGFCAAVIFPLLASNSGLCASELAYFLKPSSRGTGDGIKLIKFMEMLAKDAGVKYFVMVSMLSSMDVGAIYERLGYKKSEVSYLKVL
jgi:GNAT superfamily N-acetyltransferase